MKLILNLLVGFPPPILTCPTTPLFAFYPEYIGSRSVSLKYFFKL